MAQRKNIMLGTAGHVDHGKTSLVKMLTGCDTDRLPEEKARGVTIELGFAPCRMKDERIVGIVDVPGHVDFIRNMVAGAQGIDVVILVVAADDSVMPQTREHLDILTLMGVRHGLVALTKIDLVDPEMRQLVAEDVRSFLVGTFLENAAVCPVSNITGEGFELFFEELDKAVAACQERPCTGLFRMWIERSFQMHGFGTVVSGIPTSGEIHVGDRLRLLPGEEIGRVRRMQVYGEEAQVGRAGECVAINLADIEHAHLERAGVLAVGDACRAVTMLEAELCMLPNVPTPLKDYAEVHVHVGTADVMAHVAMLEENRLAAGQAQMVQLRLAHPLAVAPGERFVIRAGLAGLAGGAVTTVGGGRVLGASDIRLRRGRAWTIQQLRDRRDTLDSPVEWLAAILKEAAEPVSLEDLARRAHLPLPQVQTLIAEVHARGQVLEAGGRLIHAHAVQSAGKRIVEALEEFCRANPARLGMEEVEIPTHTELPKPLVEIALARLLAEQAVQRQGSLVIPAGRQVKLSAREQALREKIESALRQAGVSPPSPEELVAQLGEEAKAVSAILRLLIDQRVLVRLDEKVVMHRLGVEQARQVALGLFAKAGAFETVDFRDALGVSRKYAVPLLDYFDTIRMTVRSGSRRTPGAEAKAWLAANRQQATGNRQQ